MRTVGVIGAGNMGGAVAKGLARYNVAKLAAHDHTRAKVEALNGPDTVTAVEWADSPTNLVKMSDVVVLAVKPAQVAPMLKLIRPALRPDTILVSLAASVTMADLEEWSGKACPAVRAMPNLPVMAGKGVFALCFDDPALDEAKQNALLDIFRCLGSVFVFPEAKFDAFSAVAGCGPAYVCVLMEAMQNAAVTMGLTAAQAKAIVAATVEGTAELAASSPESFADLRGRVCSPAGTTIDAVNHMERTAVRGNITDAVLAAWQRGIAMLKKN